VAAGVPAAGQGGGGLMHEALAIALFPSGDRTLSHLFRMETRRVNDWLTIAQAEILLC
jgi:hypothetical protein